METSGITLGGQTYYHIVPAPPPAETSTKTVATGVINWSGRMQKNSLLIIDGRRASHGSMEGQLPGLPVTLRIDPQTVEVREPPSEKNGWRRMILYSGQQRYSSITIRWSATQ